MHLRFKRMVSFAVFAIGACTCIYGITSTTACLQNYYHDHLLRDEIGKVISVDLDESKGCAIVKVKVKAATGNG